MLEVDIKVFEGVIAQLLRKTDKKKLIEEFSTNPRFYCSILKDISRGKDSANYHVLENLTWNNKIIEQFVVDQARSVLSYFSADKPEDEYFEIPDEHSGRYFSLSPVVIKRPSWGGVNSRKFAYLFSLAIFTLILVLILYITRSGLLFDSTGEESTKKIEGIKLSVTKPASKLAKEKAPSAKAVKEKKEITLSSLRGDEEVFSFKESESTEGIAEGEGKRVIRLKEAPEEALEKTQVNKPELGVKETISSKEETREISDLRGVSKEKVAGSEYVVKEGDSLWEIAKRFNTSVKNLRDVNGLKSNRVDIGDVLVVPDAEQKEIVNKKVGGEEIKEVKKVRPVPKPPQRLRLMITN